jgi:hypothetical protein
LSSSGRRAFRHAATRIEEIHGPERARLYLEVALAYATAAVAAEELSRAWAEAGRPTTAMVRGALAPSPLLAGVVRAEREVRRLAEQIGLLPVAARSTPGRPVGAASAPDRRQGEPPRLTRVGDPEPPKITRAI